jgi:hypothetical protein
VTNALDKFEVREYNGKKYYRVVDDIERYWEHIEKRREDLRKELENLTGVSSKQADV